MYNGRIKIGSITANYNSGKFFKDCLIGLMNQTVRPDIISFVDDGSTDNSLELVEKAMNEVLGIKHFKFYALNSTNKELFDYHDMQFVFFKQENKGPSAARNLALKYLRNIVNVVCIADCDDIYKPEKIKKSLDVMVKYPQVGMVYSDYDTVSIDGTVTREYKEPFSYKRLIDECIPSNNSVVSAAVLNAIGEYDEQLRGAEDYDLWLRISEISCLYHLPESLYFYRMTGNNTTVVTPQQEFAKYVSIVKQKTYMRRMENDKQ